VNTYSATLELPRALAQLLHVQRFHLGTQQGHRALGVLTDAILALRWLRDATPIAALARHNGIGTSTCYRYLHETITVLATQAPDVLHQRLTADDTHVILDSTLIHIDRLADTTENEKGKTVHLQYSAKHNNAPRSFRAVDRDLTYTTCTPFMYST
jgi:hypothetical protein